MLDAGQAEAEVLFQDHFPVCARAAEMGRDTGQDVNVSHGTNRLDLATLNQPARDAKIPGLSIVRLL
jgi:hypothetical protein